MKTYLLQSFLLLFGIAAAHGQVNLSDMAIDSSDSLQKSKIRYFSPGKGRKDEVWRFSQSVWSGITSLQRMILTAADYTTLCTSLNILR